MKADIKDWLQGQAVRSWFDLGLMLDSLADERIPESRAFDKEAFLNSLRDGVAFISFAASGSGNREEVSRYAEVFEHLLQKSNDETAQASATESAKESAIWWIDEEFSDDTDTLHALRWRDAEPGRTDTHVWDGYTDIFETRLDRGSGAYNALISKIWQQTCQLVPSLAAFIEAQKIRLLIPVNVCSVPDHVPLTLALVLVSEYLGIPVLNIGHDYWWDNRLQNQFDIEAAETTDIPDSRGQFFANAHLGEVFSLIEVLFPWHSPLWVHTCVSAEQQRRLVGEYGFNPARVAVLEPADAEHLDSHNLDVFASLMKALEESLGVNQQRARRAMTPLAFAVHEQSVKRDERFKALALCENREYMPGLNKLEYLASLKSLIDPSSFRMEEKAFRGRIYTAVSRVLEQRFSDTAIQLTLLLAVDDVLNYYEGEDDLVVDHSLSYRHRQRRHYPYRKLTEQELLGVFCALFEELAEKEHTPLALTVDVQPVDPVAWLRGFAMGVESEQKGKAKHETLAIDASAALQGLLSSPKPLAWLPSGDWQAESLAWVSSALLLRLGLQGDEVNAEAVSAAIAAITIEKDTLKITLLASQHWARTGPQAEEAKAWLAEAPSPLRECYAAGLLAVAETQCLSAGTHLAQLGTGANALLAIKEQGGVVVALGEDNFYTLDTLDMPSLRIAHCASQPFASFMGLEPGQGFILDVPAGLRPSLAYPTPIQTPLEFAFALGGDAYRQAEEKLGERALREKLREDADRNGTPLKIVLSRLLNDAGAMAASELSFDLMTGLHENGDPWSGATAQLKGLAERKWQFNAQFAETSSDTVLALIEQFKAAGGTEVDVAWNGGFILNPELVGKLGLPEDYIGTPLGLLIDNGKVIAPPLFNKPAMAFLQDGSIEIRDANCGAGLTVSGPTGDSYSFAPEHYNSDTQEGRAIYDLQYRGEQISGQGRRIFRLAGNQVLEVVESDAPQELLPVGLTLVFPKDDAPGWQIGDQIDYDLQGWDGVEKAIEAGPMLIRGAVVEVEMERGGWNLPTSIRTQAARIDYMHMRGPKIGVGLTIEGDLVIAAVNGRVRESVGATHLELAQILLDLGAVQAMGFDPGGSVTLVVQGKQLNISPYNKDYLSSPYSLPPQPRFVGNAILASLASLK